jgi:hypothetical protein
MSSIKKKKMKNLYKNNIVVDTNNIIYNFKKDDMKKCIRLLCEKINLYKINAVFIFDGSTPEYKLNEKKERSKLKKEFEQKYNELKSKIDGNEIEKTNDIDNKLIELKNNFIRITDDEIKYIKEQFDKYKIKYEVASGEGDELCAKYSNKYNYKCLSNDTDMFIYGCKSIIRDFDIVNETYYEYDLKSIFKILNISEYNFKQLCILSGTDYIKHKDNNLNIFKFFEIYKKSKKINYISDICLFKLSETIHDIDNEKLKTELSKYHTNKYILNRPFMSKKIKKIYNSIDNDSWR